MNYAQMNSAPAFPVSFKWGKELRQYNGMTLRDYFAAKAMQVILQSQYEDGIYVGDGDNDSEHMCANFAYIMADAMMKARDL
tara:strand:- start:255 stop:500 length:246 start_codon:yes stop_codon:yes gene_type:complete